jgi:hypothetical protein
LSNVIASTGAVVVNRRRIGIWKDNGEARSFAKMIQREVEALSAVQHRNIIGLLGLCMDNESSEHRLESRSSLNSPTEGFFFDCLFGGQAKNSKFKLDVNQMMLIAHHLTARLSIYCIPLSRSRAVQLWSTVT